MDVLPVKDVRGMDGYEAVVLGTALYVGRWHGQMRDFLRRRRSELMDKPVALFVLGPVKDPHDDVEWENARKQTASELEGFPWLEPVSRALFGGAVRPVAAAVPPRPPGQGRGVGRHGPSGGAGLSHRARLQAAPGRRRALASVGTPAGRAGGLVATARMW